MRKGFESLYELDGVDVNHICFDEDEVKVFGQLSNERQSCPKCGCNNVIFIGKLDRKFHLPPTGSKKAILEIAIKRHLCKSCKCSWWPKMPFASGKQRMTHSFVAHILDLLKMATIKDIADHLGITWDTVKALHKAALGKKYKEIKLDDVKRISIDEISIKKRHSYMTIISDLVTGRVIHAVEGRKKEDLKPFLEKLKKKAPNLEAVAMDMSKSYRAAVKKYLPGIAIVFDRFHVMQLVNKTVDKVRKTQAKNLDEEGKKTLKGGRFLPLYNYENLDSDDRLRLKEILEVNEPLMIVHTMKEQLRVVWAKPNLKTAKKYFLDWCLGAISAVNIYYEKTKKRILFPLKRLAFSLLQHMDGIVNYFNYRITNGKAEGINNKIKTFKRQAYGYRDIEYFKLRIYHMHKQKHRLVG